MRILRNVLETSVPALKALTIGQKIAGVVLSVVIWLAPAGAVWLYMKGQLKAERALGVAECTADNAEALARGWQASLDEFKAAQASVDEKAQEDAARLDDALEKALTRAERLSQEFKSHAKKNPLPVSCVADPERVRRVNAARQDRAASRD